MTPLTRRSIITTTAANVLRNRDSAVSALTTVAWTLGHSRELGEPIDPLGAYLVNRVIEAAYQHGLDPSVLEGHRDDLNARNLYSVALKVCPRCIPEGSYPDLVIGVMSGECEVCLQGGLVHTLVRPVKVRL